MDNYSGGDLLDLQEYREDIFSLIPEKDENLIISLLTDFIEDTYNGSLKMYLLKISNCSIGIELLLENEDVTEDELRAKLEDLYVEVTRNPSNSIIKAFMLLNNVIDWRTTSLNANSLLFLEIDCITEMVMNSLEEKNH